MSEINVSLVGNPNTGKTTLYNSLTGSHEHVGNWHGVTVEEKAIKYNYQGQDIKLVDLPGIYSLTSLSFEEEVSCKYIFAHKNDIVVNICDASNLQRNLYLTLSLMETGAPVILAVNQIDRRPICKLDLSGLEKTLGVRVVYLNAADKKSVQNLNAAIIELADNLKKGERKRYNLDYLKSLDFSEVDKIKSGITLHEKVKLLEDDGLVKDRLGVSTVFDRADEVAKARYGYIEQVMALCAGQRTRVYGASKLDKVLLNRYLALPIFLLLLAGCLYITFFSLGAWLSDGLTWLLETCIGRPLVSFLISIFGETSWIVSLFQVAIVGGLGSILAFLPQVALLFFFLSVLEDSGYLSRVAFVFEDVLGKVGLSGKSVYTLLMGFGCSTTAVLTARNMEDKNSKIKTGLLTPYMSCSAKFPIYSVLGGAFFGANNIFVILGLYLLGVVVAVLLSYILEKTVLKSKQQSFILEFPPYRMMSFKRTAFLLWQNVKLFVIRVGSLILAMNIIVWLLSNFTITFHFIGEGQGVSMLETFGRILSPIFIPLGFASWGLVSALIAGLVAKEVIVSSIAMFGGGVIGSSIMLAGSAVYFPSTAAVLSYLVFCLLYFPCLATASVLVKEIGKKWAFIGMLIEFVIAYITAFVIYNFARAIEYFGTWQTLLTAGSILIVALAILLIIKRVKKKKTCPYKGSCNGGCC